MCFIFSGYENISPPPRQQLKVEETSASCGEKLKENILPLKAVTHN
jgi:hypothetical protein